MFLKINHIYKPLGVIGLIFAAITLSGCANVGGEDISLLPHSKILDTLEVPPGLSPLDGSDEFSVPDESQPITMSGLTKNQIDTFSQIKLFEDYQKYQQVESGENLSAQEFQAALDEGKGIFKVREFSNRANKGRVMVFDSYYSVWPKVISALEYLGIAIQEQDPELGVISVYGIEIQKPPTLMQRLKLKRYTGRIDELHLVSQDADVTVIVPKTAEGHEIDYDSSSRFVKRLRYLLLSSYNVLPSGKADETVAALDKRKVRNQDGQTLIVVAEPFDNAWERVGRTLVGAELSITDSNRSAGEYVISHAPVKIEKEAGWKFWIKNKERKTIGDSVQFLVRLKQTENGTSIGISSTDGENEELARKLLNLLYGRLVT